MPQPPRTSPRICNNRDMMLRAKRMIFNLNKAVKDATAVKAKAVTAVIAAKVNEVSDGRIWYHNRIELARVQNAEANQNKGVNNETINVFTQRNIHTMALISLWFAACDDLTQTRTTITSKNVKYALVAKITEIGTIIKVAMAAEHEAWVSLREQFNKPLTSELQERFKISNDAALAFITSRKNWTDALAKAADAHKNLVAARAIFDIKVVKAIGLAKVMNN